MLRCITLRLALPVVLSTALLPCIALAQSQDTQSVAEAARRAREQKKTPAKPAKVITEDDVKPATPSNPSAPGSTDATAVSGTPAPPASSTANASSAPAASSSTAPDAKDQKDSKEVTELKAQIKQALADLDLVLREKTLENDKYYSNSDYAHDTAGKTKLDELIQQVSDKQQALDLLKARLAELQPAQNGAASTPPKP
jgi:enamine deaminase RidA (YjgF/YER057c/UK114 family)